MAIRADYTEIFFTIVLRITVYVIDFERDTVCNWIYLMPATETTFFSELF